jgi:hypothetical protein
MARIGHCIINSDKESFSKRREPLRSHLFLHCERRHPRDIFVRPGITRCRERDKITRFAGSEIRISQPFKPRRQNTHRKRERERERERRGGRAFAGTRRGDPRASGPAAANYFCFYATERWIANVFLRAARKSRAQPAISSRENTRSEIDLRARSRA